MSFEAGTDARMPRRVARLTRDWGDWQSVSLYLDRCQVDTPPELVRATWAHVERLRGSIGKVLDFGAGDGRFAREGRYREYVGYEIDESRRAGVTLPSNAQVRHRCAFSDEVTDADLCIGNPPFVRNQDLPTGWRERAAGVVRQRTGVAISGLANAWQYFFLQALASLKDDGLCALIIPYEWVSRPSSRGLRDFIMGNSWSVDVYRLVDDRFSSVLTTSSITIIDRANRSGQWSYFEERSDGAFRPLSTASGGAAGVLRYARRGDAVPNVPRATRGLSPGTQKVLTLTEGERARNGLEAGRDVVPCVTSLRPLPPEVDDLDLAAFSVYYKSEGHKCWLIRTDGDPSETLRRYLDAVPAKDYRTSTCLGRDEWWRFKMPDPPTLFIAQTFKARFPKAAKNTINARAIGGIAGVYRANAYQCLEILGGLGGMDISERVVAHSNGLRKIEINQLNGLLIDHFAKRKSAT